MRSQQVHYSENLGIQKMFYQLTASFKHVYNELNKLTLR